MTVRSRQFNFLKKEPSAYGGVLRNTRKGREGARPLAARSTMHLVLRSSKARGKMSFRYGKNPQYIEQIIKRFATKNGIKILSMANVGNHLHLHIKLGNRFGYAPFIRAISGAIALAVTKALRHTLKHIESETCKSNDHFWDYRPFTRIIEGLRGYLSVRDYIKVNQLEGTGVSRPRAYILIKDDSSPHGGP